MIRYPASRVLPSPEDINYHLNRVLMRQAARCQAYSPGRSVYSSPSLGSGSGYESAGSSWPESKPDQDPDGEDHQQQSEAGGDSSRSTSTGSCVIHREPKDTHASRYLSLLQQPRRFTPRAAKPQTHSHSLPFASASDSQVASLRIWFETLSLNSLSSAHCSGIHRRLSPRLVQGQSTSQVDIDVDIDIDPRMDKNPQSDMAMEDAPALTSSTVSTATTRDARDAREPAVVNRGESTSGPGRKPRKIQKTTGTTTAQSTRATLPRTSGQTQGTAGTQPASMNADTDTDTNANANPITTETLTSALSPEKWAHMMDASRAFHAHVQQMLAELDDEYDTEDEFGMRELRRRPPAAAAATAPGRGSTTSS